MDDLITFIAARLDDDEAIAKAAQLHFPGPWDQADNTDSPLPGAVTLYDSRDESVGVMRGSYVAEHIARHDPARVLRDVAAKRAIVAVAGTPDDDDPYYGGWDTAIELVFRHLAAAWSDHPDYKQEWAQS